jgi:electron transport protein HydN
MHYFVKGNPDLCIGCRTCMIGCVVAHEGLHIFEVDPDSYTFNPKLHMVKTAKISVPVQCKHCENPACLAVCPTQAITQNEKGVFIDTAKCMGCKSCMTACPFGAIDMVPVAGKFQVDGLEKIVANKCDLCDGLPGGPACVRVCPTAALQLVKEESLEEAVERKRQEAAKSLLASNGI